MSRLNSLSRVKGQSTYLCGEVHRELLHLRNTHICTMLENIPCAYCPLGVSLNGRNNYLYLTNNQLETNHERTDQESN